MLDSAQFPAHGSLCIQAEVGVVLCGTKL